MADRSAGLTRELGSIVGIVANAQGRRFLDEGADFRNYTYAKYGRRILEQPGQFAWQVFDQKVTHLLRDEYKFRQVSKVTAPTLEVSRTPRRRRPRPGSSKRLLGRYCWPHCSHDVS